MICNTHTERNTKEIPPGILFSRFQSANTIFKLISMIDKSLKQDEIKKKKKKIPVQIPKCISQTGFGGLFVENNTYNMFFFLLFIIHIL